MDLRINKAAEILVNYSTKIQKNDYVQIQTELEGKDLALECYKLCLKNGAYPTIKINLPSQNYIYYKNASMEQLKRFPKISYYETKNTDAFIFIRGSSNTKELTNIDSKKIAIRMKTTEKINQHRVDKTKWVVFNYPTNALAQDSEMSLPEFEDFVYNCVIQDWELMGKKNEKIKNMLDKGKNVHIIGKDTDLKFSIKGRKAINCSGEFNMPDGEVFIAPVENTVEGYIRYDFPAIYNGKEVDDVRLKFKNGRVIKAEAKKNEDFLKAMINTDKGSHYLGEFGIGTNYKIDKFTKHILFDEKIGGTIHLALGMAYKQGGGRNKSAVHWDMIKDLRENGKVLIDGKVLEENGKIMV